MVTRLLVLMALALPVSAAEIAGVKFDPQVRVAESPLTLKGVGLRKRFFFQVYAIGLYVQDAKGDAVAQGGAKRVAIHMLRDVDAETFTQALVDGIRANHDEAAAKGFEPRIAQLSAVMAAVKEAKKGMAIALDWVPGVGTRTSIDGQPAGQPIEGEDFYRALLRIWLGDKPVQDDLKQALLGG